MCVEGEEALPRQAHVDNVSLTLSLYLCAL